MDEKNTPAESSVGLKGLFKDGSLAFDALFESAHIAICLVSTNGKFLRVNREMCRLFGYDNAEFLQLEVKDVTHPDDIKMSYNQIEKTQITHTRKIQFEKRYQNKNGSLIWAKVSSTLVEDDKSGSRFFITYINDITETKVKDRELEDQLRYSRALNKIAEAIIREDNEYELLSQANRIIGKTLQLDRTLIYHVSFDKNRIEGLCEWLRVPHADIQETKDTYSLDLYKSPFTRIQQTKEFLISHYDAVDKAFLKDGSAKLLHEHFRIKSLIWYPFAFQGNNFYVFTLNQILEKRSWTESELEFVGMVAMQVNLALIKINFLKEINRSERTLKEKNLELVKAKEVAEQNANQFEKLFENNPVALWEEDLSEVKKRLDEKKKEEKNLAEYINNNPEFVFELVSLIRVKNVNKATVTLFEAKSKKELIENIAPTFNETTLESLKRFLVSLSNGDYYFEDETEYLSLTGKKIKANVQVTFSDGLVNSLISIVDITKLKEQEREILKAKERAEQSDRLKSAFLLNMSHEIRTPMNGILGFTELLKKPHLSGEKMDSYIKIIEKSGHRMLSTINDIIDISKIESGQVELNFTRVSPKHLLEEQYEFFKPEAQAKGIELSIEYPTNPMVGRIRSDKVKLESILTNLIKNAIKFTSKGSIKIAFSIREFDQPAMIEFYISDTGIGIPADRIDAVFNRFEQADIEDTKVYEGSGLGLAIAKAYTEMLNGKIWVESKLGLGTKFSFTIPYEKVLDEPTAEVEKKREGIPVLSTNTQDLMLIVAEDDEASISLFESMFTDRFSQVIYTKTGRETINAVKDNPDTNIILMDIKMPDINGYTATREIRKFNDKVIIIAQTAFGLAGDREKALEAGCDDYISKPIDQQDLFSIIEKQLKKLQE